MQLVSLAIPYLYILHVLIVSIRVGSTLLFAPIWGYPGLPQYLRVIFVFSIAAGLSGVIPFNPAAYTNPGLILPTEFLIGALLTMGIRIAFAGLHLGGQLLGYHLGFSAVQSIDPQTQNRSTMMSGYLTLMGYVIVLATNQHHNMFRALADSYRIFPIGATITTNQWFGALIEASKQIFIIGWKIALPVFLATFLLELTVGFIARMQPQMQSMIVTAPLKILIGLVVLGASFAFMPRVMEATMNTMVLKR
jgi:flagellar biosynthetic protein FliR